MPLAHACVAIAAACSSCAMVGSNEHYRPVEGVGREHGVSSRIPLGEVDFLWWSLGGAAGSYRVPWADGQLEIAGGQIDWDQDLFGPILPVFPVFLGASRYKEDVDVELTAPDAAVTLVPDTFRLVPTRMHDGVAPLAQALTPKRCVRTDDEDQPIALNEALVLSPGECIRLVFDSPVRRSQEFELRLSAGPGLDRPVSLAFRYHRSRFVSWMVFG